MIALAALFVGVHRSAADSPQVYDREVACGLLEINHLLGPEGEVYLTQVLVWDWDYSEDRYRVRAWCAVPSRTRPLRHDGRFVLPLLDTQARRLLLTAPLWRETWSTDDPESAERGGDFRRPLRWK